MKKQPLDVHLHIVITKSMHDALDRLMSITNQAAKEHALPEMSLSKSAVTRAALGAGLQLLLNSWPEGEDNESED